MRLLLVGGHHVKGRVRQDASRQHGYPAVGGPTHGPACSPNDRGPPVASCSWGQGGLEPDGLLLQ
eukprot:COSAG02_NODE_25991_length_643_cov_14.031250_1_plen_64_part_10